MRKNTRRQREENMTGLQSISKITKPYFHRVEI